MSDSRVRLSKGALFSAFVLWTLATGCSSDGGRLAPAAQGSPEVGAPRSVATPNATSNPTSMAGSSSAPSATPTNAQTPAPAASTVAATCGTVTSFASSQSGGQIATGATANCQTAVTLDYPSFTLSPATSPNPYVFRLDYDTTLDTNMKTTYGAMELCKTAPGVLYATFEFDAGTGGPSITFGTSGPDGIGGSVVSSALMPGRTYTAYAAVTKSYFDVLGSGTFTATTASNGQGEYSGSAVNFTPSNYAIPSQTVGELEACATS